MREENEEQKLFREHVKTAPQRALLTRLDRLSSALDSMAYKGLSKMDRDRLKSEGLQAISQDLEVDLKTERDKLSKQMDHIGTKFEKLYSEELPRHSFELSKYERKFKGMSEAELAKHTVLYLADESTFPDDPGIVDAFSAELISREMTLEHSSVREKANERSYEMPWLRTPEGSFLNKEIELNSPKNTGTILCDFEEGRVGFSIEELAEGV
jgi:hypothetical protein